MKNIILTLVVSVIILGLASFLFSFDKLSQKNPSIAEKYEQHGPERLPASRDAFLTASLNPNFIPIRNWSIEEPEINAKAAGIFDFNGKKFLYTKNIKEKLPIASLTKIMTAIIALESFDLDEIVTISKKAVMTEGENGHLIIGEKLAVRDLLYIMLIESSNDAAVALAGQIDDFVVLMNEKARGLKLENTNFTESTGISQWNYSTVSDLIELTNYSFNKEPLIWQIFTIKDTEIFSQDKKFRHYLENTNQLLGEFPQMIGGKTGFTEEAGGCMLTMVELSDNPGQYLITVILGAENRELETKKLIEWAQQAYVW